MPFLGKVPSQIVDSDVDIDGGTIDGATIGSITAGAGTFTSLSATGTITFPDDGISGDDINGGTISNFTSTGIDDNATSTAITIDSSENVGIGTTSPVTAFEVEGSGTELIRVSSTSGNSGSVAGTGSLGLDFFSGSTHPAVLLSAHEDSVATYFSEFSISLRASNADTTPTERMRIDSSGNVGIGSTAPTSDGAAVADNLVVKGTGSTGITITSPDANNATLNFGSASDNDYFGIQGFYNSGSPFGRFSTGGTERMRIDSNGKVGIGVSNPAEMLDINEGSTATYIRMRNATSTTGYIGYGTSASATDMTFWTAATKQVTIDGSGNVGIGTDDPDQLLDVGDHTAAGNRSIRISQRTAANQTTYGGIEFFYDNSAGTTGVNAAIKYAAGPLRNDGELTFHTGASASISERLRIDHNGRVGIGTTSPSRLLTLSGTGATLLSLVSTDDDNCQILFGDSASDTVGKILYRHSGDSMAFETNAAERMRIDSSGNVLVGTTDSAFVNGGGIKIANATAARLKLCDSNNAGTGSADGFELTQSGLDAYIYQNENSFMAFGTNATERMRIDPDGRIAVGTSNPDSDISFGLDLNGFVVARYDVSGGVPTTSAGLGGVFSARLNGGGFSSGDLILQSRPAVNNRSIRFFTGNTTAERMTINAAGAVNIVGSLSKGSGSFKIDHPLPSKTDTHYLVHSFIEGPQADNIYRGTVNLVDGSATVNLDTAVGMSEGTFVCLNTNVQCFTSNESGWTAVKGSVSGNVLTITAQETCGDVVSWMVVGERCDQHMLDTEWTDENGRVIVQPLKGA